MVAKHRRIAEQLKRDIEAGIFRPEERLPGELELARSFDVSRSTIRQALSNLQEAGLIETWAAPAPSSATMARGLTISWVGRKPSQGGASKPPRESFVSSGSMTRTWPRNSRFPRLAFSPWIASGEPMLISLSRWSAAGCLGGPPLPRRFGRDWSRDPYGALWIPSAFGQQAGASRSNSSGWRATTRRSCIRRRASHSWPPVVSRTTPPVRSSSM